MDEMSQEKVFVPTGKPLTLRCQVGEECVYDALSLQQRAHGRGKRYFQMGLALVLSVGMFLSWGLDKSYTLGLVLGFLCLGIFLLLLLLPGQILRRTAQMMAENLKELEIQVYENGIVVKDGLFTTSLSGEELAVYQNQKLYLFETRGRRLYPLPREAVEPVQRRMLERLLQAYPVYYSFSK